MRRFLRVLSVVLVLAVCLSSAMAQSGQWGAKSRFRCYNTYALDTLRIINTLGQYAVKTNDLANHQKFTNLRDRFAPIGFQARELLEREAESETSADHLERQWKELIRSCIEFRKEIDPNLVKWASRKSAGTDASADDWGALSGTEAEIPEDVLFEIRQQAAKDYPGDHSTQQHVVERQIKAYRQWQAYDCMRAAPFHVYQFVRDKAAGESPGDYATQLHLIDRQMRAYEQVQQYEAPFEVDPSHLLRFKEKAAVDHPYDFSTQLFVIQRDVDKYLELRRRGASGDAIVRHMLRR